MTRIYAIRTGQYSDTSWGPVFSTPEKALAYQRKLGTDRYSELCEIEVHVLDDEKDVGLVYENLLDVTPDRSLPQAHYGAIPDMTGDMDTIEYLRTTRGG